MYQKEAASFQLIITETISQTNNWFIFLEENITKTLVSLTKNKNRFFFCIDFDMNDSGGWWTHRNCKHSHHTKHRWIQYRALRVTATTTTYTPKQAATSTCGSSNRRGADRWKETNRQLRYNAMAKVYRCKIVNHIWIRKY